MSSDHLAADFRNTPYWHDTVAPVAPVDDGPTSTPEILPGRTEVAIIGAGFTGMSAALELSRAGRDVIVLDTEGPGAGCSSRNGGLIGPS